MATECRYTKLLETCEHENDPERPRQKPDLGPGARKGRGTAQSAQRQRALLADTIAYAGANSPYYRELCRELPEPVECPEVLPVTDKDIDGSLRRLVRRSREFWREQGRSAEVLTFRTDGATG